MSSFKTDYWKILNKFKDKIETVKSVEQVIFGEKVSIQKYPIVFILSMKDTIEDETVDKLRHNIGIRVVVLSKGTDVEATYSENITLATSIYDEIMEDRTFDNDLEYLYPVAFDPSYSIGTSSALFWVSLEFRCTLLRAEG